MPIKIEVISSVERKATNTSREDFDFASTKYISTIQKSLTNVEVEENSSNCFVSNITDRPVTRTPLGTETKCF